MLMKRSQKRYLVLLGFSFSFFLSSSSAAELKEITGGLPNCWSQRQAACPLIFDATGVPRIRKHSAQRFEAQDWLNKPDAIKLVANRDRLAVVFSR